MGGGDGGWVVREGEVGSAELSHRLAVEMMDGGPRYRILSGARANFNSLPYNFSA